MNNLTKKFENELRILIHIKWWMHRIWFWVAVCILILGLFKVNKIVDDNGTLIFWGVVAVINFIAMGKYPAKTGKEPDLFDKD